MRIRRKLLTAALAALALSAIPAAAPQKAPPKVLVIADSISLFAFPPLGKMLGSGVELYHCTGQYGDNGSDSSYALEHLHEWIGDESGAGKKTVLKYEPGKGAFHYSDPVTVDFKWDVIVFNHGLWDASKDLRFTVEKHQANIEKYVERLKKTGATIVWTTTTPYYTDPEGDKLAQEFDKVDREIMKKNGIAIADAGAVVRPRIAQLQLMDGRNLPHLNEEGSRLVAESVAREVVKALKKPSKPRK